MNGANYHLLVNHFPIFLPLVGAICVFAGLLFKHSFTQRLGYVFFVVGALTTAMAMGSGEEAEEVVEGLGVSHDLIHEHEEKAELLALVNYVLGALALVGLWLSWKAHKLAALASYIILAVAVFSLSLVNGVGHSGGEIMHKEIRKGFVPTEEHEEGHEHHEE